MLPSHLHLANYKGSKKTSTDSYKPSQERQLLDAQTATEAANVVREANGAIHSSSLTWAHTISWLRSVTSMKIILKGVMTEEDAQLAVKHGADAIVVSNHGGRQLDSSPWTLEALPSIANSVKGKIPILFDGGVRQGSDVFKALALGAGLVMVGRPVLWGMSYDGQRVLSLWLTFWSGSCQGPWHWLVRRTLIASTGGSLGCRRRMVSELLACNSNDPGHTVAVYILEANTCRSCWP